MRTKNIFSNHIKNLKKNEEIITAHNAELESLKTKLEATQYDIDETVPAEILSIYERVCQSFEQLLTSQKIWVQLDKSKNNVAKSSVSSNVKLKDSTFGVGVFNYIKSKYDVPIIPIDNQLLYIYPEFAILSTSPSKFEVIDYSDMSIIYTDIQFKESNTYPKDAERIGTTWEYINKNGEPDRRYTNNRQYPIVRYGGMNLIIKGKLSVTFQISNASLTHKFCSEINGLINAVSKSSKEIGIKNSNIASENFNQTVETKSLSLDIFQSADKLFQCLVDMTNDRQIIEALDNQKQLDKARNLQQIGGDMIDKRLAVIAMCDLVKSFEKLGHQPNMATEEGRLIGIVLVRIIFPDNDVWSDRTLMYKPQGQKILMDCYNLVKNNFQIEFDPNKFLLIEMLKHEGVSDEIINKWAVLLYRYTLLIAKADGFLSDTEQKWITNILSFTKIDEIENNHLDFDSSNANGVTRITDPTKKALKREISNPMTELENLIGLAKVKKEISNIYNLVKIQKVRNDKGMKTADISFHCVFTGNPGTGKTTVARLIAQIYKELGILRKGHLIETDRSGLVAEYVGQTAVKTNKIIDSALDGVLFIDEAYSLVQNSGSNDFGLEAIATLLKRMEDNRDRLVVILAGYSDEMEQFINSNPGLQSRFNRFIHFEDYSAEQLISILEFNLSKFDYKMTPDAVDALREIMEEAIANKNKSFGNARFVRNLFEKTLERQAKRLVSSPLSTITEEDLVKITKEDLINN